MRPAPVAGDDRIIDQFTIGTLNVGGLRYPRQPLTTLDQRAPALGAALESAGLDVINLQEIHFPEWLRVMREHLPSFPHVAVRRGPLGPAGGLATFSRWPLRPARFRSFGPLPPAAGDLRFRARLALMSALHGMLTVRLADHPITIVNTHLTANHDGDWSATNRHWMLHQRQLRRLDAHLTRRRTDLLVATGDYNVASDSDHYPLIVGRRRDPFADVELSTFHAAFLDNPTAHRIDYVLLDGDPARFPVLAARPLLDGPVDGSYLSDHVALVVTIGLSR